MTIAKTRGIWPNGCVRILAARFRSASMRTFVAVFVTIVMMWPVGLAYGVVITELPDSQLLWGDSYPETDYPQLKFYTNYGSNRYEALGKMLAGKGGSSAWPVLTADQRAYLSNPETGGDFYLLAQELHAFDEIDDVTDVLEIPTPIYWWVVNVGLYSVQTGQWQNPEWLRNLWYMDTTQQNIDDAIQAVEDVLRGDIPGGGGGSTGTFKGTYEFTNYYWDTQTESGKGYVYIKENNVTTRYQLYMTNLGGSTVLFPANNILTVTPNNLDTTTYTDVIAVLVPHGNNSSNLSRSYWDFKIWFIDGTYTVIENASNLEVTITGNAKYYSVDETSMLNMTLPLTWQYTTSGLVNADSSLKHFYITPNCLYTLNAGVNETPAVPPTNWPDPTPTPVPPTSPTVPVAPIINNTNNYTQNTYNTTNVDTSGDVTALLQKILQALDTHCVHLQNTIADELEINAKWITDTLDNDFGLLLQYLEDLADWLKANWDFDYEYSPYDDSTLIYWVKKIYKALGTGGNTRPVDPVTQPDEESDWITELIRMLIEYIFGTGVQAVGGLGSDLANLATKFPFSIPWDLAAMLAAFVHEPVTPRATIPMYTVDASSQLQQVGTMVIDLSAYNDVMPSIRLVEYVLFAALLASRTNLLLEMIKGVVMRGHGL